MGSLGLVDQSPDSLSIAEYVMALGDGSSRPAPPSGDVSKAAVSLSGAAPDQTTECAGAEQTGTTPLAVPRHAPLIIDVGGRLKVELSEFSRFLDALVDQSQHVGVPLAVDMGLLAGIRDQVAARGGAAADLRTLN